MPFNSRPTYAIPQAHSVAPRTVSVLYTVQVHADDDAMTTVDVYAVEYRRLVAFAI